MNVASLELCKELFELSGWGETGDYHLPEGGEILKDEIALYNLGYLLRKMPPTTQLYKMPSGPYRSWLNIETTEADTPEDATCMLAIELFKRGVITKVS